MRARILDQAEWPRLAGTEAETLWPHLPASASVVVVEDEGRIVGCHVLMLVLHAECLWVHPDYRKRTRVAWRLWQAVKDAAKSRFGADGVQTAALSDEVRGLLAKVGGVPLPGDHYMVSFQEAVCPSPQ